MVLTNSASNSHSKRSKEGLFWLTFFSKTLVPRNYDFNQVVMVVAGEQGRSTARRQIGKSHVSNATTWSLQVHQTRLWLCCLQWHISPSYLTPSTLRCPSNPLYFPMTPMTIIFTSHCPTSSQGSHTAYKRTSVPGAGQSGTPPYESIILVGSPNMGIADPRTIVGWIFPLSWDFSENPEFSLVSLGGCFYVDIRNQTSL